MTLRLIVKAIGATGIVAHHGRGASSRACSAGKALSSYGNHMQIAADIRVSRD
jgi:hypothetical protein